MFTIFAVGKTKKIVIMKGNLFSQIIIGFFILFSLLGCNSVSSDPKEGADQLMRQLSKCTEIENLKKANSLMSDYYHSYNDEQLKVFFLTLRDKLMTNDDVVEFIVESDFQKYPMCGLYLKFLHQFAYEEAKLQIHQTPKVTYNSSAALKAILIGMSLADCYDRDDMNYCNEIINDANDELMKGSLFYEIEFAAALKAFIQESGETGIKAFEFLTNRFDGPSKYAFYRLLLETNLDLDFITNNTQQEFDDHMFVPETREKNLPTKEEIQSVNAMLPVQVAEGTICTKVEYDEQTMIQTFYYDFTQEVDESLTSPKVINNHKIKMVNALKRGNKDERIRDGVTYVFIYRSINKKVLYKIKIDASDFD